MLSRLRQPRYLALTALMFLLGLICTAAGAWQVARFDEKVHANDLLRANFHAAAVPVGSLIKPYPAPAAPGNDVKFRRVTLTGTFDASHQVLVRNRTVDAPQSDTDAGGTETGFFVLTPFIDSTNTTLLVTRGFVAGDTAPSSLPTAPSGRQTITARVFPSETKDDHFGQLPSNQIDSINVGQWSRRVPHIYDGWATLIAGQPGTAQLTAVPDPSLANPAGGAQEWQHLAYVIQWFVFALLAFLAPLLISRHETRLAQQQFLGIDPDAVADRATRELASPEQEPRGALVRRQKGEVTVRSAAEQRYVERAKRLADRYGYALEVPDAPLAELLPQDEDETPARDAYHGAYNDYLWQIAMADEQEKNEPT